MNTSYKLPQRKSSINRIVGFGVLVALVGPAIGLGIRDDWVFDHMTNAQHLWEARNAAVNLDSVLARRHLGAISSNSSEATDARIIETEIQQREASLRAAETAKQQQQASEQQAYAYREELAAQLESDLRNLGYDLSVEASREQSSEIVITSKEFADSDHRVRFLSFMRRKNGPDLQACLDGFSELRLRSSRVPYVGFSASYSLDCP